MKILKLRYWILLDSDLKWFWVPSSQTMLKATSIQELTYNVTQSHRYLRLGCWGDRHSEALQAELEALQRWSPYVKRDCHPVLTMIDIANCSLQAQQVMLHVCPTDTDNRCRASHKREEDVSDTKIPSAWTLWIHVSNSQDVFVLAVENWPFLNVSATVGHRRC